MDELVKRLHREAVYLPEKFSKNAELLDVLMKAADAIEELQNKLCDWCGVCPKERRRPSDCEIIYPNMQVPEIAIIPTEEGET